MFSRNDSMSFQIGDFAALLREDPEEFKVLFATENDSIIETKKVLFLEI